MDPNLKDDNADVTDDNVEVIEGEAGGVKDPEITEKESGGEGEHDNAEDGEDEVIVTIGDDVSEEDHEDVQKAPEWVRNLRKQNREQQRELKAAKSELDKLKGGSGRPKVDDPGKKPALSEFDYDTEKYETALDTWYGKKRAAEAAEESARLEKEEQDNAWNSELTRYETAKGVLKVSDFEDAESVVLNTLDQTQQGIIVQGSEDAALVVYALGKNPGRATELAAIKNPIKFAFEIARLEKQLKVRGKRKAPPPEQVPSRGAGKPSASSQDRRLDELRAEAQQTGDFTKVMAHRRAMSTKT